MNGSVFARPQWRSRRFATGLSATTSSESDHMRRLQYSIRSLFMVLFAVSLGLVLVVKWLDQLRADFLAEQEIARMVNEYGGTVAYASALPAGVSSMVSQSRQPDYVDRITSIWLPAKNQQASAAGLELLPQLKQLKQLSLITISGSFQDDIYRSEAGLKLEDLRRELPMVTICVKLH